MSESTLRTALIKLAATHPEFRKDLLPLLKTAADKKDIPEGVNLTPDYNNALKASEAFLDYVKKNMSADKDLVYKTRAISEAVEDVKYYVNRTYKNGI